MPSFEFLRIDLLWDRGLTFCMSLVWKFSAIFLMTLSGTLMKHKIISSLRLYVRIMYYKRVFLLKILTLPVLRMLCRNPDGLFWAGDTAQTISAGSSFRFKDLKAFLHRVEVSNISRLRHSRMIQIPYDTATQAIDPAGRLGEANINPSEGISFGGQLSLSRRHRQLCPHRRQAHFIFLALLDRCLVSWTGKSKWRQAHILYRCSSRLCRRGDFSVCCWDPNHDW